MDYSEIDLNDYKRQFYELYDQTQQDKYINNVDLQSMLGEFSKYVIKQITAQKMNVNPVTLKHFDVVLVPIEVVKLIEKRAKMKGRQH